MVRIAYFDNARAISVLWIVGFWHMIGYWESQYQLSTQIDGLCQIITWTALAAFTYFSGYFLGGKTISNIRDIKEFYKKRLKRFYILYFLSATTLFIAGIYLQSHGKGQQWFPEISDYVYSLFGLATYIGNPPATLWYFCMLMSFYALTPLINYQTKTLNKVCAVACIYLVIILLSIFVGSDERNCIYFPFYVLGLFRVYDHFNNKLIHLTAFILYMIICMIQFDDLWDNPLMIIIESFIGIELLLQISKIAEKNKVISIFLSYISIASMVAYLFHRQICGFFKVITPSDFVTPLLTTFVYLPIVFISGYFIQKFYNKAIK